MGRGEPKSGGNFSVKAEVLFDRADALKRVVDLLAVARVGVDFLAVVLELGSDAFEFRSDAAKLALDAAAAAATLW
jgi:hypothetical protein